MRLQNKVAIVTGGAEGIGKAYCLGFVKEGAKVVIADINFNAAKALEETIVKQGQEALAVKTDVSKVNEVGTLVKKTIERFGKIDILLNNAGKFQRNPAVRTTVWEMDPVEWEKVIAVNLTGVFLCCRAALPHMIKQKSGKIINVASSLAFFGTTEFSHYVASKGGVVGFTRAVCREVGPYNINVNTLCPGYTLSGDLDKTPEPAKRFEIDARVLKRAEYPEDLVGTAIYLASADSDFLTGQAIVVDGGNVMH
ncbi:MAG TPA: 3-oxoacyl-ACP reductase family protein [Dehalococcoidales bacterium]